ncbi:NUDIX domain-containing protein [Hymenobacter sp.]|uniref:NUDIX domain-containing protein n=1 Tax=Hymenobacter sp. TaxID=1898978 RepID=UPI00286AD7DA|nr:NUDIX domain-containing protein [Hymenobacter sp.]
MSPYLRRLREKIGHDLLLLPSVTVLLFDADRRVLLARHSDANVWVAPGGMVEPDETPQAAARREAREEIGCEVALQGILGVYGGPEFLVRYRNGDKVSCVMTVFEAAITDGTPQPDHAEILELRYFTYAETRSLACARWLPVVLADVYGQP